ncbi:hypothetical protein BDW25_0501 [Staphylococcus sp. AtDRG32]|uniref:hypothetical protein n=2 Tax=Staphylococcus TaxID=1279 RepID=UPI001062EA15|nr:hypothetical protein [Staphylococcus hominis]QGR78695.1 hypothetical protein FOC54_01410 [Staphylococcus hominis]TDW12316.1 hypothetical protein BDW25_0501 [Staphylococcus sp. AtDRG32]
MPLHSRLKFKVNKLFILSFFIGIILINLYSFYYNNLYLLEFIILVILNISLFLSFKITYSNRNITLLLFLIIFPLIFIIILLFILLNIGLIIVQITKVKFNVFIFITIFIVVINVNIIYMIFKNWYYYSIKKNKKENKYLTFVKESYALIPLISTLVIPIINLGFPKGESLSVQDTFSYLGVAIGGTVVCTILDYIYKHIKLVKHILYSMEYYADSFIEAILNPIVKYNKNYIKPKLNPTYNFFIEIILKIFNSRIFSKINKKIVKPTKKIIIKYIINCCVKPLINLFYPFINYIFLIILILLIASYYI